MTIGHEVAHAIDCALDDGVYRSGYDTHIRAALAAARVFATPYAASGFDDYFAECVRAYAYVLDDARSPWPRARRERLHACDPAATREPQRSIAEGDRRVRSSAVPKCPPACDRRGRCAIRRQQRRRGRRRGAPPPPTTSR